MYTLSGLSWSAVSIVSGASSYKQLVQVSLIFSAFCVSDVAIYASQAQDKNEAIGLAKVVYIIQRQ